MNQAKKNRSRRKKVSHRKSIVTPNTDPSPTDLAHTRRRYPWVILVLGLAIFTLGAFSTHWIYEWTTDPSPMWAQASLLGFGLLGLLGLLHAWVSVQLLAAEIGEANGSPFTFRAVTEKAIAYIGSGAFLGTLLAVFSAGSMPANLKLSSLISDLATVGGIVGLASLLPHHVVVTHKSLRCIRSTKPAGWLKAHITLGIIDAVIVYKLLYLLPALLAPFR